MTRSDGMLRLLLVDDSLTEADNVTNTLRSAGHAVRASREDTLNGIEQALTQQTWDLLICRAALTSVPPRELLNFIHRLGRDLPCIVLTSGQDDTEELYDLDVQDITKLAIVNVFSFQYNVSLKTYSIAGLQEEMSEH